MAIEITARHLDISPELQQYARGKADELVAAFPKVEFVHVVLDTERHLFRAEFIAQHKGVAKVEATETTGDMLASIDGAYEKVEKQLRKHHTKVVDSHHHRH